MLIRLSLSVSLLPRMRRAALNPTETPCPRRLALQGGSSPVSGARGGGLYRHGAQVERARRGRTGPVYVQREAVQVSTAASR